METSYLISKKSCAMNSYAWQRQKVLIWLKLKADTVLSVFPKVLEPAGGQFSDSHGVLVIPVSQVGLQRARIMPFVGQRGAAGVSEHVRVGLKAQPRRLASPPEHTGEACSAKRRAALRCEHKGGPRLLFALQLP